MSSAEKYKNGEKLMVPADGFPYGTMRCSLTKYPEVLAANERMFQLLGMEESSEEWQEFIRPNVFFMIPFEARAAFQNDLKKAAEGTEPVQVEHLVRTGGGATASLIGWVWTESTGDGGREYVFSYMPVPETCLLRGKNRESAYRAALENAYDGLFRLDRRKAVVECVQVKDNLQMAAIPGARMILDDVLLGRFFSFIREEDRRETEQFVDDALRGIVRDGADPEIEFQVIKGGRRKDIRAIRVDLDDRYVLLCCNEITRERYAEQVVEEMEAIRSINREIDRAGTKQPVRIGTYRVVGDRVLLRSGGKTPGNVREMPLDTFLERCKISREEYDQALREGKAVLSGSDHDLGRMQQLYIVRSPDPSGKEAGLLLFLYTFEEMRPLDTRGRPRVTIHTFGYFDVLVDGKPVLFHYEKSKEMLAILVDRKGSFVANPYFISCLWENEPYGEKVQNRCRQTAYRMMETLRQYGIEDIIEKADGRRRIVPERVDCDYFHYIQGDQFSGQPFNGAYMSDYSWGEETLSMLLKSEALRLGWTED